MSLHNKPYNYIHALNGTNVGDGLVQSNIKYSAAMTSGASPVIFNVPAGANTWAMKIVTESGTAVWYSEYGAAAAPAGTSFASSSAELIPSDKELIRKVVSGQQLSFFSTSATANVSLAFYVLD